ncbi:Beta-lactamase transpeptidase-like protein [Corynebacterium kutscheri]|uniref:Beta-lactamase transpeptidase-like protein n=1 Tax=Corynebacterium kutscheri TaxID=35755 RepID=A0AB38VS54_9CORY|nr:serine hydrolase domain-containing protein [Corynebacterium kutscheri]VEH06218.1 Beta-lactamase transpeptidase-like protein [Corynebacterium kutscheri]VEH82135.1 Beta-lactamase transpeptidase-like protein [Corynebacterium kutscheri]
MTTLPDFATWPVDNVSAAIINGETINYSGDAQRIFELASVTKLLAGYVFLIAIEEGVFELDTPVHGASVRQLLSHAGGVGFKKGDEVKAPGKRRIYSSYGFELLAEALEVETGMSYTEYFNEALCVPLGMTATTLWGSPGHEARSNVQDLTKFAVEVLRPTLIDETTLSEALTVQYPELAGIVPGYGMQKPCPWGLAFEIKGGKAPHWTGTQMPVDVVGHFGQSGTYLWVHRMTQRAMVVLTDRAFGQWAKPLWQEVNDAVWGRRP